MLVYSCADLIFATKIRGTAESLGVPSRPARDLGALRNRLQRVDDGRLNDAVTGVVVDLELGEVGLSMVQAVKEHNPDIPVVVFGSHVATDLLRAAHEHGADFVFPRSQFTANLPSIITRLGGAEV